MKDPFLVASLLVWLAMGQSQVGETPNSCDLCSGDPVLVDQQIPLLHVPCSEVTLSASQVSPNECAMTLIPGFDLSSVCCENREPLNLCTLCSSDEYLIPSRTVRSQQYGEVTCKDFEEAVALVNSMEMCQSLQEQAAEFCCVDLAKSALGPCELRCPNGAPPADLEKKDPVTGYTCSDLIVEYSKFPDLDQQCLNSAASSLGFDGVAFCCPDVDPLKECSTCPSGQELLYPERVLFLYHDHSCSTLDESLAYVVGKPACQRLLDESRAENNCLCRPLREDNVVPTTQKAEQAGFNEGASGIPVWKNGVFVVWSILIVVVQSFGAFDYF